MPPTRTQKGDAKAPRFNPLSTAGRRQPKVKGCKPIFAMFTISIAGSFGAIGNGDWTHEKMARWITNHAGTYVPRVTTDTTHLICTIDEYKSKSTQVKEAWKLGSKCHIVVPDWLEDCLNLRAKVKRVPEKDYKLSRVLKRMDKSKDIQKGAKARFEEGVRAYNNFAANSLSHIYYDDTAFEYKVVLTRIRSHNNKESLEKYTLYLFESHAMPHLYMHAGKYSRPGVSVIYDKLEDEQISVPKLFKDAFADFTNFFRSRTGIPWDERLEGKRVEGKFVYTPPKLGRPVGLLPWGYVRPEERAEEGEDGLVYETDSEAEDEDEPKVSASKPSTHNAATSKKQAVQEGKGRGVYTSDVELVSSDSDW